MLEFAKTCFADLISICLLKSHSFFQSGKPERGEWTYPHIKNISVGFNMPGYLISRRYKFVSGPMATIIAPWSTLCFKRFSASSIEFLRGMIGSGQYFSY